jgi:hypothetical protein
VTNIASPYRKMRRGNCVFRGSANGDDISARGDTGRRSMDAVVLKLKSGEIRRTGADDPNEVAPALNAGLRD